MYMFSRALLCKVHYIVALCHNLFSDATNDHLNDETWNYAEVFSEAANKIFSNIGQLPDNIPFNNAREMNIKVHVTPRGKADVYVDDKITI